MRIVVEDFGSAKDGAAAGAIAQKDMDQAARNLRRHLPEVSFAVGVRGEFDLEVFAVVVMKLLQGLDKEIIHREPDGAAPVRIAAEYCRHGFPRFIRDTADIAVDLHFVWMVFVKARQSAHAIRGKEFVFVQHRSEEHTSELQSHSDLVCRLLLEK